MKDENLKLSHWYRSNPYLYIGLKNCNLVQGTYASKTLNEVLSISQSIIGIDYLPKSIIPDIPSFFDKRGHYPISRI